MAFAVRQWPEAPDPRGSFFSFAGWNWGQVVSFQWIVASTNASHAWSFLNAGFVVPAISDDGFNTRWERIVPGSGGTKVTLHKLGRMIPTSPPQSTIQWEWTIDVPSTGETGFARILLLFPDAIQVFGPAVMLDMGSPIPDLPDPVTITPAIWDFSLP